MNESNRCGADFIGYEYKEISVASTKAAIWIDGYKNFGWQESEPFLQKKANKTVTLYLRRDRKISNKMELTRLQRNFEASMEELETLEHSKTTKPQRVAFGLGIVGTVFMAGSTFAVTATPPIIWLCILLAIPGFIGWILPWFFYQHLVKKRTAIVTPLIEQKYDEIYELYKKGNDLI